MLRPPIDEAGLDGVIGLWAPKKLDRLLSAAGDGGMFDKLSIVLSESEGRGPLALRISPLSGPMVCCEGDMGGEASGPELLLLFRSWMPFSFWETLEVFEGLRVVLGRGVADPSSP